jgi:2-methylcitrate dehydratase PrpD
MVADPVVDANMSVELEDIVCSYVAGLRYDDLPATTVDAAKRLILDTLGAILAAPQADTVPELTQLVADWGGAGEARILGSDIRIPAHHAALVNGTRARALEIDDVHEKALLHATATIVPVALACIDMGRRPVSGQDFITAVAIGIDLCARFSLAPTTDIYSAQRRAMSYTYQTGILIGALAAGRILGFSQAQLRNALGVAYSQCAGNQQGLLEGVLTVRVQQGLSAMTGVLSARLSEIGITGAHHSLEGVAGFFNAFHRGSYERAVISQALGRAFEVDNVSIKPYPCCKFTHTSIAAALEIRNTPGFDLSRIRSITVHIDNGEYFDIVCRPVEPQARRAELADVNGYVRAQFCMAYLVAVALVEGRVDLEHLTDTYRNDERILAIMDKVKTLYEPLKATGKERVLPAPGVVEIAFDDGRMPVLREVKYPKGHPQNQMSLAEVAEKFRRVVAFGTTAFASRADDIVVGVETLERISDMRHLLDLMTPRQ